MASIEAETVVESAAATEASTDTDMGVGVGVAIDIKQPHSNLDLKLTDLFIHSLWGDSSHDFLTGGGIIGDEDDDREVSIQEMGSILSLPTDSCEDSIVTFIRDAYKAGGGKKLDDDILPPVGAHGFEEMGHKYLYDQLLLNGKFFFANPSNSVFGEDLTPSVNIQPQLSSNIFAKKSDRKNFPTAMQYNKSWSALRNLYHPYDGSNIYGEIVNTLFLDLQATDKKQMIKDMILKNLENPTEKTNIIYVDALGKAVESLIGAWSQIILHYKRNQMQTGMLQGANISTIFDEASQIVTKFSKTIKELHTDFQIVNCNENTFFEPFTVDLVHPISAATILRIKQEPIRIENIEIDKMNASIMENLKKFYRYFLEEFKEPNTFKATDDPLNFSIVTERYERFKHNLIQYWNFFAKEKTRLDWVDDKDIPFVQEALRWDGLYYHEGKTPSYNTLEYWKYYGYIDVDKLEAIGETEFFFIRHDNGTTSEHFYSEESRKKLIDSQLSIFKENDARKTAIKEALIEAVNNDATLKQMLHPEGYVSNRDLKAAKKIINPNYESSSSDESETDASSSDESEEDADKEELPKPDSSSSESSSDEEWSEDDEDDEDDESDWNRLVYFILCNYFKDPIDYRQVKGVHFDESFERAKTRVTFRTPVGKVERVKKNLYDEYNRTSEMESSYDLLSDLFSALWETPNSIETYKNMGDENRFDRCIGKEIKYFCDLIKENENDKGFKTYDGKRLIKLAEIKGKGSTVAKIKTNMQEYEPLRCLHPFLFSPEKEDVLSCRKYIDEEETKNFLEGTFSTEQQGSNYYKNSTRWNKKYPNDFLSSKKDNEPFLKEIVKELFMYDFNYFYEDSNEFEDESKYKQLSYTKKYNRYVIPTANQSNSLRILEEVSTQFNKKLELNPEKLKAKETITYLPDDEEKNISFSNDYPSVTNCVYMWRKMLMMFTIMFDIGQEDTYSKEDISEYLNLVPVPKKKSNDSDETAERGAKVSQKLKEFQTELVSFMFSENNETTIQSEFYAWFRDKNKKVSITKEEKNKKMPKFKEDDIIVYTIGKKKFAIGKITSVDKKTDGTLKKYVCQELAEEDAAADITAPIITELAEENRTRRTSTKPVNVKEEQISFIKEEESYVVVDEKEDDKNTENVEEVTAIHDQIKHLISFSDHKDKESPSLDLLKMMYSNLSIEERNLVNDIVNKAVNLEDLKQRCKVGLGLIKFTKTTADFMQFAIVKHFNEKYGKNNLGLYVNHIAATFDKQAAIIAAIIDAPLLFEKKGNEGGARGTYVYIGTDKNISSLTEKEVDEIIGTKFDISDPITRMIVYKCLNYDPTVTDDKYWEKKFPKIDNPISMMKFQDEVDFPLGKLTEIKKDLMKWYLKKNINSSCKDILKKFLKTFYELRDDARSDEFYEKTAKQYLSNPEWLFNKLTLKYKTEIKFQRELHISEKDWDSQYEKEQILERIENYEELENEVNIAKAKLYIEKWEAEAKLRKKEKKLPSEGPRPVPSLFTETTVALETMDEIDKMTEILNNIVVKVDEIKRDKKTGCERDLKFLNKYIQSLLNYINELKNNSVEEAQFAAIQSVQDVMKKISIKQHSIDTISNRSGIIPSSHDKIKKMNDFYVRFEYDKDKNKAKKNMPLSDLSQYTLFKKGEVDCVNSILELRRKKNGTITEEEFQKIYEKSMEELHLHYINPFLPILEEITALRDGGWDTFMKNMVENTINDTKKKEAQLKNIKNCLQKIGETLSVDIETLTTRKAFYSPQDYVDYLNGKFSDDSIIYINQLNEVHVEDRTNIILDNLKQDINHKLKIENYGSTPVKTPGATPGSPGATWESHETPSLARTTSEVTDTFETELTNIMEGAEKMDMTEEKRNSIITKMEELVENLINENKELKRIPFAMTGHKINKDREAKRQRIISNERYIGKWRTAQKDLLIGEKRKRGGKGGMRKLRLKKSLKHKRKHFSTRSKKSSGGKMTKKHIRIKHNTKKALKKKH